MASFKFQYPDHLNPFGCDEDEFSGESDALNSSNKNKTRQDDYPEYLSPFGHENDDDDDDDDEKIKPTTQNVPDDYDDSLNPFGDIVDNSEDTVIVADVSGCLERHSRNEEPANPFGEDVNGHVDQIQTVSETKQIQVTEPIIKQILESPPTLKSDNSQPESLEPPKPLPRTKSLLKKEQAQKRQRQQQLSVDPNLAISSQSITPSTTSSISLTTNTAQPGALQVESFQRQKPKRKAPPLPINFRRQVCGSLEAIEGELEGIGDKLAIIEKESDICQEALTAEIKLNDADFGTTRNKFAELIKRKNSILRRQKELMYKKRELKLDQIHSDIEYELRMIGNKQLSNRTTEDDVKEKELLEKLVEIVEEKNDIVENLNKDPPCDKDEIEEAFKRLNILDESIKEPDVKPVIDCLNSTAKTTAKQDCDKSSRLAKLGKIATLLPKSGTLKGTMKIKRKRLFKKSCDPQQPIQR